MIFFLLLAAKLALHVATIGRYGYFRDELYYLACSRHLAWGYVDHPPLSIALLALVRVTLGESLVAIRLLPALAGAATLYLAARIARELGGGRYAQALAALATLAAPQFLGVNGFYSMNSFDILLWPLAALLLLKCLADDRPGRWLLLGLVIGLGIENKLSMLWLAAGFFAGLAVTRPRALLTKGPWITATVAALLALPHVLWQAAHGWPTLEFIRNATEHKMVKASPLSFLKGQVLVMNPLSVAVWGTGLVAAIRGRSDPRGRVLGVAYLAVAAILLGSRSAKAEYLTPAYTMLFAAGAVAIERTLTQAALRWLRVAIPVAIAALAVVLLPFALPVLSVDAFVRYSRAIGITPPQSERQKVAELPQHYADMFGWEDMASTVADVYRSLPPEDRARAAIVTQNYGEAGAIDLFGRRLGLPNAISGHNSYWMWGYGAWKGDVLVIVGGSREDYARVFETVEPAATIRCEHCMPYERDLPVYVARRLKVSLEEYWRLEKLFI